MPNKDRLILNFNAELKWGSLREMHTEDSSVHSMDVKSHIGLTLTDALAIWHTKDYRAKKTKKNKTHSAHLVHPHVEVITVSYSTILKRKINIGMRVLHSAAKLKQWLISSSLSEINHHWPIYWVTVSEDVTHIMNLMNRNLQQKPNNYSKHKNVFSHF